MVNLIATPSDKESAYLGRKEKGRFGGGATKNLFSTTSFSLDVRHPFTRHCGTRTETKKSFFVVLLQNRHDTNLPTDTCNYDGFRLRLHGTLERFCVKPFRVGTDRLPVYTISWNRSVQNHFFQSIHALTFPDDSLSLHLSGT